MISKLGRFEIKDLIGRGAMGEVYLGVDPALGREVAIKTITSSTLSEDQTRLRFDREAKAAAILNHPNIVTIHELGEDQGMLFIAMERLKGLDLEQCLLQKALTLVESLEVLAQVCDGLDAAHRNHIIHRDIKPSNIMVMREGRKLLVKIMDFGVARLKDSAMTAVGTVMGTVNYIAPEYIKSGEPDARSDLFAVGVMLYECISGKKPFDGGTASTVLFKIVNDPPPPLDLSMLRGLSPALRNMTERALSKDPDDRFQTAEEFALALRAAKDPSWNGRIEEATLRMRVQPDLAPPPASSGPAASSQSSAEEHSFKTVAMPLSALEKPAPAASGAARGNVGKTVVLPALPVPEAAKATVPEPLPAAEPTIVVPVPGAKDITQEVVVPPEIIEPPAPKTAVPPPLPGPEAVKATAPEPLPVAEPTVAVPVPGAKDITQEVIVPPGIIEPPAPKTVVLPVPQVAEALNQPAPAEPTTAIPLAETAAGPAGPLHLPERPIPAGFRDLSRDALMSPEPAFERSESEGTAADREKLDAQAVPPRPFVEEEPVPAPENRAPTGKPRTSRTGILVALATAGLALLGGAGYYFLRFRKGEEVPPPPPVEAPPVPPSTPVEPPPPPIVEEPASAPEPPPAAAPKAPRPKPKAPPKPKTPPPATTAPVTAPAPEPAAVAPPPPPPPAPEPAPAPPPKKRYVPLPRDQR